MPSIFENGQFRDLTESELYPEPNNWYCANCGTEFTPVIHLPACCTCPTCGTVLHR